MQSNSSKETQPLDPSPLPLEIKGRIFSSKNSQRLVVKNGRVLNLGNKRYRETRKLYSEQLRRQFQGKLLGPLGLHIDVWVPNESWAAACKKGASPEKYAGEDVDNKASSIFDLLQFAGVIENDAQIQRLSIRKHYGKRDHGDYGALILINTLEAE